MTFARAYPIAAALCGAALLTSPAHATATCADRMLVLERLSDDYGETRQSLGLGANNGVVEVFASDETGTWTITVTMPNGKTCLLASGDAFEAVDSEKIAPTGKGA